MTRTWGPPPRCGVCGRFASVAAEVEGPTACECGATLPARPFLDTPPLTAPTGLPRPQICGTALLSMARIEELRALGERARISVRAVGDELWVCIALGAAPGVAPGAAPGAAPAAPPGRSTPDDARRTQLGVVVLPEGAPFSGGTDAPVEVAEGSASECRVPRRNVQPGSAVTVVLRLADALYERVVTVAG